METFHTMGAPYYAARLLDMNSVATLRAARAYQTAAVPSSELLDEIEAYLLSIERDKELAAELERMETLKYDLAVILNHLTKYSVTDNELS
jgi:hypothetical protein